MPDEHPDYPEWVIRLTTSPGFAWFVRHVASRVDPILFKATHGRMTLLGPPVVPMLTLTAKGRRSGQPRSVHLACLMHEGHPHVVASAMGQEKHPAWRYNLEANPDVEVQMPGVAFAARAEVLSDAEKAAIWPRLLEAIPQLRVYQTRTDRNIRVFRLRRRDGANQES